MKSLFTTMAILTSPLWVLFLLGLCADVLTFVFWQIACLVDEPLTEATEQGRIGRVRTLMLIGFILRLIAGLLMLASFFFYYIPAKALLHIGVEWQPILGGGPRCGTIWRPAALPDGLGPSFT